jgi:hypothetical protein
MLLARTFLLHVPTRVTAQMKDLRLSSALGSWLPGSDWFHRRSNYFYSAQSGLVYHAHGSLYNVHTRLRLSRHQSQVFAVLSTDCVPSIPPDSIPVDELSASGKLLAFRGLQVTK